MQYKNIIEGTFVKRINRFIAKVLINGEEALVHVKNTGRCKELFIEGSKVYLEKSDNPNRKTKYSLISIYKGDHLINIDSQVPNQVVFEAIQNNYFSEFTNIQFLKREQTYENSRFDIYYETETEKGFIEIKGVTLENKGIACFPDAPTLRGSKHVQELIKGQRLGYKNYIFFLIQLEAVNSFKPNIETDPHFSKTLKEAEAAGVKILCYSAKITTDTIEVHRKIAYCL